MIARDRRERIAITDPADLDVELEELKAEIARLRAALEDYGDHREDCPRYRHGGEEWVCDCGFLEALESEGVGKV